MPGLRGCRAQSRLRTQPIQWPRVRFALSLFEDDDSGSPAPDKVCYSPAIRQQLIGIAFDLSHVAIGSVIKRSISIDNVRFVIGKTILIIGGILWCKEILERLSKDIECVRTSQELSDKAVVVVLWVATAAIMAFIGRILWNLVDLF